MSVALPTPPLIQEICTLSMSTLRRRSSISKAPAVWDQQARQTVGSLFERLVHDEEDRDFPAEVDPTSAQVASIKRHLVNLLNTRVGGSASSPDLGVSDFNYGSVESNDMIKHIEWSIRHCITTYEPRVANATVESQTNPDDPLDFRFRIFCDVLIGSEQPCTSI